MIQHINELIEKLSADSKKVEHIARKELTEIFVNKAREIVDEYAKLNPTAKKYVSKQYSFLYIESLSNIDGIISVECLGDVINVCFDVLNDDGYRDVVYGIFYTDYFTDDWVENYRKRVSTSMMCELCDREKKLKERYDNIRNDIDKLTFYDIWSE